MAKLNIAPTKSNLLNLERQLDFAQEGYDLLEQKRQILIFELMSRLSRAEEAETKVNEALRQAYDALKEATLDIGSEAIDSVTLGIAMKHEIDMTDDRLMGMGVPKLTVKAEPMGVRFGVLGTSSNTDIAMARFIDVLPLLAELAELERRTNALSKIFIPQYRETIDYITGSLEERERESLIILKMIRDRLAT
jgi:V/A-type H+-transporting ATPase subunit D